VLKLHLLHLQLRMVLQFLFLLDFLEKVILEVYFLNPLNLVILLHHLLNLLIIHLLELYHLLHHLLMLLLKILNLFLKHHFDLLLLLLLLQL
jgi:hypothetical protein